jgi:hypothetical protein
MSSDAKNVPVSSSIFYTNTLLKNNDNHLPELRNSIVEDQFDAFKKRDHYLRKSTIVLDSINRPIRDTIQSSEINFLKIGFLMNQNYTGQIFLYLPNTKLENNSLIYFTNLSKLISNINEISTLQFEFNKLKNGPIFNLTTVSNKTALEIFGWSTINSIIQSQYSTKEKMVEDDDNIIKNKNYNFYSFFYTTNTGVVQLNNYSTLFITKKPNLFKVTERLIGYPNSSYFKLTLAKSFNNIYKIRLLDISLPDVIFNINNDTYVINNYKYLLNGKLRFMMYDDQFLVSNIDYVGARIKYDFFQKEAVYDVNGFNRDDYKFAMSSSTQKYPHFYLANDIYQLMMNILNNMNNSEDFLKYANNNIFEVAYFFLQQFHLYYNTDVFSNYDNAYYNSDYTKQRNPNKINKIYYIYTSDTINSFNAQSNFILRTDNTLNIKTPLVYFNDYLLYVNNETFNLSLAICNWMDYIFLAIDESNYTEDFGYCKLYCLINNIDERVVGTIQDINRLNPNRILNTRSTGLVKYIYYTISLKVTNPRYNSQSILGQPIYALYTNTSTNYVLNTIDSYLSYSVENNTYYYKLFLDFTSIPYTRINTNIYQYNSTVYRLITTDLINETNNIINKNFTNYILILGDYAPNFVPESIVGITIYSQYNDTSKIYVPNTVSEFVGQVTINSVIYYAYKMSSYEQSAFNKFSLIYRLNGPNQPYTQIGKAIDIFDVYYNVRLNQTISNFTAGTSYVTNNLQKMNYFIKSLGSRYYLAAYSSETLLNYNSNLFLTNEQIYLDVVLWQANPIGIVSISYLEIGSIQDVQFDLILDGSLYLSENNNYDVETQNVNSPPLSVLQTKNINERKISTQYTSVILLDNIRIIETKTQTKNYIINYTNKRLLLKNSSGISFETEIVSQPIYDKQINMFVFRLSLKIPGINIGTIYTTKSFIGSIDGETIGTGYSICYMPLEYTILVEKSDDFQMEYLQNWSKYVYTKFPNSKFVLVDTFINRNYSIFNPEKTNLTGFTNYNMIPIYEITLENGDYDNITLVTKIETQLNKTSYLQFDYLKKTLDINDNNIKKINEPNYEEPRFKVIFNETTKKIEINSYKILNRLTYKAQYNAINPFIYFKIGNAKIEHNKRIFIEVLRDAANSNITNEITKLLNKEFTTRILPIFEYEIRIISPVPDLQYIDNVDEKERIIPNSIIDILRQISINPFQFRSSYPGLTEKMRFVGQTLKNIFSNSNSYTGNGNIAFNAGIPCAFKEDELVIVINNIYYNYEVYKIGRIVKIVDTTSNYKGNYQIMIQLSGETEVSQPIFIGDILYGLTSQTIGCVVPYEWGILTEYPELAQLHAGLPTEDIIRLGYKNYLKLLYNASHREYLLDYIHKYSLENFVHYNSYTQIDVTFISNSNTTHNSLNNWPISEVKNCYNGFEIYFEFPVSFEIDQTELVLYFLKQNRYCLFAGKNRNNVYDTPKDILGFNDDKILNVNDYVGSENNIPWNTTFDNTNNFSEQSINKMYITYGSDNILQSNMYLLVDDTSNYKKGDTVYINDLNIRTDIQRSIFNMYNSSTYNIHRMFSFDIYLTFIAVRLAFIKSGVPLSMGPNDYLGIISSGQYGYLNMWQYFMMRIPNSLYVEPNKNMLAYVNLIYENFNTNVKSNQFPGLNENISANLKNVPPLLKSQNVSDNYAFIINKIILGKILPWFIQPENLLLWTKGARNDYIYILETYIEISNKNIWRFELEIIDEFIFKKNIMVKDKNGNIIGKASFNNQYSDYSPVNNASYVLYIYVVSGYDVSGTLNELDYIYADDMLVKNRLTTNPIHITDSNKYIYLYDTYLKFKTIIQIVPDNTDTIQKSMNFNKIDSINSLMMNLFNLDNQNINCFKNGYYVNFGKNEIYPQDTSFLSGQHRILINLLDNKNLLHMCFYELGLISEFNDIKNDIINMPVNNVKDIVQIYSLLDIFQLLIDLSPINTVMVDLNYTQLIENNIHNCFQYQIRMVDNIYSICGSRNFVLESISYQSKFIYGTTDNPNGDVVGFLNNYFSKIYSDVEVETYKATGTIEPNMCNLTNIYNKNSFGLNINSNLTIYNEPSTFIYGAMWVPGEPGDKSLYVIVPAYSPFDLSGSNKSVLLFNKNNLANYLITINFIYIDQQKSINVDNIEKNDMIQSNVIESIQPIDGAYERLNVNKLWKYTKDITGNITSSRMETCRIFKINLKYELKYNVIRGTLIQIRDYYTIIYKQPDIKIKNNFKLYILQNWIDDKQFVLKPGYTIRINYGSYNSIYQKYINNTNNFNEQLSSFDVDDIVHEETNLITGISSTYTEIGGKKYWELTLLNPIKYEFKSGLPIIININPQNNSGYFARISDSSAPFDVPYENISESISNANDILTNGLATQNIIVNGEWYTKIFYQSEKNIDLYDLNPGGVKSLNNISKKKVNISGMKGYVVPNVGFQSIERNYYNSVEVNLEDVQSNTNIKPVPDGLFDLVQIQKEDNLKILNNNNDISISGFYNTIYSDNSPEQEDEWIDNFQNIRWYYAIETNNISITDLSNIDLFQINTDNTSVINPNITGQPYTIFDKICRLLSVETTSYVFEGKAVFKVYVVLNIKNLINIFLYGSFDFVTVYSKNIDDIPYNMYLSTYKKTHNIQIIYYGIRESVDYDYSYLYKRYNYYSITIKGRFQGYGGSISFDTNNNIFNSIPYTVSDVKTKYNTIELDLQNNTNIFLCFYRFNTTGYRQSITDIYKKNYNKSSIKTTQINPAFTGFNQTPLQQNNTKDEDNEIVNYYDIFPSKYGFLANDGIIFKKTINQPLSTNTYEYIYLCFKNIESTVIVEQENQIGNYTIFAKVYKDNVNINIKYTSYEVIYDLQLKSKLNDIEVFFLDKKGNLVNFNNIDVNFQLEIYEYVERVKNINTQNGMVF